MECWDFRYSVKNSLGFLLVHNFSQPNLFFFNFEVDSFQPNLIVPALKPFGKKLQPISLTNKNVLKMTPEEDAIVIKISSQELALYKNLDQFLSTRQAYKYSDIPVQIKDFELFETVTYIDEDEDTDEVYLDVGVMALGEKCNIALLELADQDFVILWKGDISLGEGVSIQSGKILTPQVKNCSEFRAVISTSYGERCVMNDLFLIGFEENWEYVNLLRKWEMESPQIFSFISCLELLTDVEDYQMLENGGENALIGSQWNGNYDVFCFKEFKEHLKYPGDKVGNFSDVVHRLVRDKYGGGVWGIDWDGNIKVFRLGY